MNNPLLELLLVMLAMLIWAGEVVVNEYWMHIPRTGWSMLAPGVTNYCEINPTKEKGNWPRSEMTQAEIDEFDAIYERVDDVRDRYRPLFRRQPNRNLIAALPSTNADGERIIGVHILIGADPLVDQNTLPIEDRIPDCIEGVPVRLEQMPAGRAL